MKTFLCVLLLLSLTACSNRTEVTEESKDSALPSMELNVGDDSCSISPSERRGVEPNLSAWKSVSDAIFVGTVSRIERVTSPVYLSDWDYTSDSPIYTELLSVSDCPEQDSIRYSIKIHFTDVETLHGDDLGSTVTIQMGGRSAASYPGVFWSGSDTHLRDSKGNDVYYLGSRVGAALFKDSNGQLNWKYRQFEVLGDEVFLQKMASNGPHDCYDQPIITSIPDQYDGLTLSAFKQVIRDADTSLAEGDIDAIESRHSGFLNDLSNPLFQFEKQTLCFPSNEQEEEDPKIPNDPALRP
jgi:hypothetical protein